jgi:two-component system chemotaxis response regulator CheY
MATILIVDDASFMRGSLKFIVENAGHEVVGMAKDGREALELYKKHKPNLVTLDILMEEMDGISALKSIMAVDHEAKVIMVTALGQEEKQAKARKLGASGYIRKPFTMEEINDEIEKVMGNAE